MQRVHDREVRVSQFKRLPNIHKDRVGLATAMVSCRQMAIIGAPNSIFYALSIADLGEVDDVGGQCRASVSMRLIWVMQEACLAQYPHHLTSSLTISFLPCHHCMHCMDSMQHGRGLACNPSRRHSTFTLHALTERCDISGQGSFIVHEQHPERRGSTSRGIKPSLPSLILWTIFRCFQSQTVSVSP